ncbi:hypothetical protein DL89DRAFT_74662 [Linderina pennispora]|uniref:Uncharacterized protein n=1 Tax=Linderina pennispora TaxID=61395 RepID=A0A1Y1VQL9_9FUNG|nr:uncharacterized protein DL89DRAFT_74662 [Linderina pennispora]ORX63601.1 hypothetical protein DL89DRAFT_74662 [Linderina pennispora]
MQSSTPLPLVGSMMCCCSVLCLFRLLQNGAISNKKDTPCKCWCKREKEKYVPGVSPFHSSQLYNYYISKTESSGRKGCNKKGHVKRHFRNFLGRVKEDRQRPFLFCTTHGALCIHHSCFSELLMILVSRYSCTRFGEKRKRHVVWFNIPDFRCVHIRRRLGGITVNKIERFWLTRANQTRT